MECMDRCMAIYVPILKHMNTLVYYITNYPFCHIHIKNTSWQQPANSPAASCKERHGRISSARRRGSGQRWKRRSRRFTCQLFLAVDATRFHTKNCLKFAFQHCLKCAYFCLVFVQLFLKNNTNSWIKIRDPTIQVRHQVLGASAWEPCPRNSGMADGVLLNWWIHDFLIYWQVLFKCKHPAESVWAQDASANQRGTTCSCLNFRGIYLLFRHLFCLLR